MKAWVHSDGTVWWQIRDFVENCQLLGRTELFCQWLRTRRGILDTVWEGAGVSQGSAIRGSRTSQKAVARASGSSYSPGCVEHDEWTVSSAGLLVMFIFLRNFCHSKLRRSRVALCLRAWLELLLPGSIIDDAGLGTLPPQLAGACALAKAEQPCVHAEGALACLRSGIGSLQSEVAEYLFMLWTNCSRCPVVTAQWQTAVARLSAVIDRRAAESCYTQNPRDTRRIDPGGNTRRRRRIDEDYKRIVIEDTINLGLAKTPRALMMADGRGDVDDYCKWSDENVLGLQASAWLTFTAAQHFSVIGDCARLGNPGEETLVMGCWSADVSQACWLPPQALGAH